MARDRDAKLAARGIFTHEQVFVLKIAFKALQALSFVDSLKKCSSLLSEDLYQFSKGHCIDDNNHQELAAIEADKQRLLDKVKNLIDKLPFISTSIYLPTR